MDESAPAASSFGAAKLKDADLSGGGAGLAAGGAGLSGGGAGLAAGPLAVGGGAENIFVAANSNAGSLPCK